MLLFLPIAVLLAQFLSTGSQNPNNYNPKGWKAAKNFLSEFMDPAVDPCKNFTSFMCANFGNASDPNYYTWDNEEQKKVHIRIMVEAINAIDLNDTKTNKPARLVRNFYDQCMKAEKGTKNLKAVYDILTPIMGPHPAFSNSTSTEKSEEDVWYLMGKLQSEFGEAIAIDRPELRIMSSDGKTRQGIVLLKPTDPATFSYSPSNARNRILRLANLSNIQVDKNHMDEIISETNDFIDKWQNVVSAGEPELAEFGNFTSDVSWPSYWKGLLSEEIMENWMKVKKPGGIGQAMLETDKMDDIAQVFNKAPLRAVKAFLYNYFFYNAELGTVGMNMNGNQLQCWFDGNVGDMETVCVEYVLQQATPAAVRVYFDHVGEDLPTWRNDFLLIGRNIFSSMRLLLNSIDYMAPKSKEIINRRMDNIRINPGIPTWIMDEDKVVSNSIAYDEKRNFFANAMRRSGELLKEEMRSMLLDPENVESDPGPTMVVNSNFQPWKNNIHINVFLGYNLPPYFSHFYPLSIKYALTGFVLGHELMHAFDPGNINSNLINGEALTEDELENYQRSASCLIKQYSRSCYSQTGVCQVGSVAIQDNVADIGGLKAAFAAYQFHKSLLGEEPPVESFTDYTHDQLFFMAFQRFYCTRNQPPAIWAVQGHSPSAIRAKVALRNSPHFAASFKCPVGSNEAPITQCKMWGDILN